MPNLNISFTPASPAPANGYRVKYWNVNTPGTIITVTPNPSGSPVSISGVAAGCYAGTVESACAGSQFSSPVSFNACSGAVYCVQVSSEGFTEASTECSGFNDAYTVYTFTLKDSNGATVNAPSAVTVTFAGWTNYPGGAGAYNGSAIILTGNSSATATVYTSQALNGAPGCPCPCETTVSIDSNSFAASIASPSTVSICGPTYYYYSVNKYLCDNSCALAGSTFVARSSTQLSTTSGTHYLVGNATYVINTQITPAPASYDVNLDGASTGSSCAGLCPSGGSGGGSGGGGGVNTYDCVNGNCVATVGGAYNSLVECQQSGCAGGGGLPQE